MNGSGSATGLTRFLPAAGWLRAYQRALLPRDSIAGFTIWGLLIPEMIAYASDVRLGLVHLPGPARSIAQRGGLLDQLPADRIHPNLATAAAWAGSG